MILEVEVEFNIGDTVYLKTDTQQLERIVTSITIFPNDITYRLNYNENESFHYGFEITKERDVVKATT